MARRRRGRIGSEDLLALARRLVFFGGGMLAVAVFFPVDNWFRGAVRVIVPAGVVMLVIGLAGLGIARLFRGRSSPEEVGQRGFKRDIEPVFGPVVDRTPTELERLLADGGITRQGPPRAWSGEVFDMIEWRRFEAVVERLFQQAGFQTKAQSHGADGGIDIWLFSRTQVDVPVSVVQCKHWSGKRVGVDKVRELRGVMAAHNVLRGQFATTSLFTSDAVAFAQANGINLLDVNRLLALIGQRSPAQQAELLAVATEGEYWRPTCVNCGVKMVERTPKAGGTPFWGCAAFPRCRTTMPMRATPS